MCIRDRPRDMRPEEHKQTNGPVEIYPMKIPFEIPAEKARSRAEVELKNVSRVHFALKLHIARESNH
eukprot:4148480-Amphidinium_carterae.1